MFHAIFEGVSNRKIASRINIDTILAHLERLDVVSVDYLISILSYTGNEKYMTALDEIKNNPLYKSLDVEDYSRCKIKGFIFAILR